ncbi:TPA: hypothetical protein EYP37_07270, partial [Candidatus Poribacteria bacterium]|nr:hypothetical protein [Candidatus Poribacteria bacterium]
MIPLLIFSLLTYSSTPSGLDINYQIDPGLRSLGVPDLREGTIEEPPGYPGVKTVSFLVGVPQKGRITWQYTKGFTQKIEGVDIEPVRLMDFDGKKRPEESVYNENRYYPDPVSVEGPFNFRDLRVIRVKLAPIRYNPVTRTLIISRSISLKVKFEKPGLRRPRRSSIFEPILKELILNYEECQGWRIGKVPFQNQFSDGPWYKIAVAQEGVYRIGYPDLEAVGINPRLIDPRTVKIYGSDFHTLPRGTPITFVDTLIEIPTFFQGGGDGQFDLNDYLIFYGRSANWFTVIKDSIRYNLNPYSDTNCYWLTWGGTHAKRMELIDGTPRGEPKTHAISIRHIEENEINLARSGLRWLWREILFGDSLYIHHPDADGQIDLSITLFSEATRYLPLELFLEDNLIFSDT